MPIISLESLEEKFRAVEEASERRALYSDEPGMVDTGASMIRQPSNSTRSASTSHCLRMKRPASVSFFGQSYVSQTSGSSSRSTPSPIPTAASQTTFIPIPAKLRYCFETFISKVDDESPQGAIEVRRIAGHHALQDAMGSLLPRRTSRTQLRRSHSMFVTSDVNVVVGVSIEQTTSADYLDSPSEPCFIVHAPKRRRTRGFTVDLPSSISPSAGNLGQKAVDFARRIRRKQQSI